MGVFFGLWLARYVVVRGVDFLRGKSGVWILGRAFVSFELFLELEVFK